MTKTIEINGEIGCLMSVDKKKDKCPFSASGVVLVLGAILVQAH